MNDLYETGPSEARGLWAHIEKLQAKVQDLKTEQYGWSAVKSSLEADLAATHKQLQIARDAFVRSDNELILLRAELGDLRGENQRLRSERDEARGYAAGSEA